MKAQFSESTGHFTQLVWKDTTKVGCGAVHCNSNVNNGASGWYLVCEYTPRGNVIGAFKQNVGKAGEGPNGQPGMGAASRLYGASQWLVALVAASSLAAMCI